VVVVSAKHFLASVRAMTPFVYRRNYSIASRDRFALICDFFDAALPASAEYLLGRYDG